jgi:hypothetical protein
MQQTSGRRWPVGPLVALALGLAVLALPAGVEGPAVVPISPGHALSMVDLLGALPLTVGALWLEIGLWRRRAALARWTRRRTGAATVVWFGAGLRLGLLLASAFSRFFWWWAVGAVILFGAGCALVVAAREG